MKRNLIVVIFVVILAAIMSSCGTNIGPNSMPASTGGLYELMVVCPDEYWDANSEDSIVPIDASIGDTLRVIYGEPVFMINQFEPRMDILRIRPSALSGLNLRFRNILIVKYSTEYKEPLLTAEYDAKSRPQLIVSMTAPNKASLIEYMHEHRTEMLAIFEMAERDRYVATIKRYNEPSIMKIIDEKFNFAINVPKAYKIRSDKDNFLWVSNEYPLASQGFFIHSHPYTDKSNFSIDSLVYYRDKFAKLIPGPSDNSWMRTYTDEPAFDLQHLRINGRYWACLRGFWDVENDFMGGPFVSYSTLDVKNQRVVTIDCYVISPKQPKRNYLRMLEHLIFGAQFPGDAEIVSGVEDKALTEVKTRVKNTIQMINNYWVVEANADSIAGYLDDNMVVFYPDSETRVTGKAAVVRSYRDYLKSTKVVDWADSQWEVNLYNENQTAIVSYYFTMTIKTDKGTKSFNGKDMYTLILKNGKWVAVSQSYTAIPNSF